MRAISKFAPVAFALVGFVAFSLTSIPTARACAPAFDGRPEPRPVGFVAQAAELRAEAERLDARALASDRAADSLVREGDNLFLRARALRLQAVQAGELERDGMLARAEAMASQASIDHDKAAQLRAGASELRARARVMRERAIQLAGRPGGWRPRPMNRSI